MSPARRRDLGVLRPAHRAGVSAGRLVAWSLVVTGLLVAFWAGFLAGREGPLVIVVEPPAVRLPVVIPGPVAPIPTQGATAAAAAGALHFLANPGGAAANSVGTPSAQVTGT